MSCLADSIARFAPSLQEKVEKVHHAPTFALLILAALDLGRALAVMVAEEILNERGQAPDKGIRCEICAGEMESKGLKPRKMLTLIGWVTRARRLVVLVGTCKAIAIAERNAKVRERHTGLSVRLQM